MSARRAISRVLIAIVGGKSAAVAAGATLASALWIGATVPSLSALPSAGGSSQQLIAISLQSALLGIDDKIGRAPIAEVLAAARTLGLAPTDLHGLTPERLRQLVAKGSQLGATASSPLVVSMQPGGPDSNAAPPQAGPADTTPAPAPV